jgi:allantoicase
MRGMVHGVNVDTSHFTGNYPSHCSIEAVDMPAGLKASSHAVEGPPWITILEKTALRGNGDNLFQIADRRPWTHLRLSIYPDGGVARLRVFGEVAVDWDRVAPGNKVVDLALITNGGWFLGENMGDGWETRRRRGPGHDWAIIRLGAPGIISKIEIDTNHFKGNYPDRASLEGVFAPNVIFENLPGMNWTTILPETKMFANKRHFFTAKQLQASGPFSHVRLNMFPDGGISRLRVYGSLARD